METVKRGIERRVAAGDPLDHIEQTLLRSLTWLDDERRSALWLYAWLLAGAPVGTAREAGA